MNNRESTCFITPRFTVSIRGAGRLTRFSQAQARWPELHHFLQKFAHHKIPKVKYSYRLLSTTQWQVAEHFVVEAAVLVEVEEVEASAPEVISLRSKTDKW